MLFPFARNQIHGYHQVRSREPLREELAKSPDAWIQKPDDPVNSAGMPSVTSSNDTLVSAGTDTLQSTAASPG